MAAFKNLRKRRGTERENVVPRIISMIFILISLVILIGTETDHTMKLTLQELNLLNRGDAAAREPTTDSSTLAQGQRRGIRDQEQQLHRPLNDVLPPLPRMPLNTKEALGLILAGRKDSRGTFVQVGANDGQMFDQLYPNMKDQKERWIGLQVEPQPELYSRLAVLHADAPDWAFYLGAVVAPAMCKNGTISFCETKTPGEGDWKTQGQVNRVTAACRRDIMHYKTRPCVTSMATLIHRHSSPTFLKHVMEEVAGPKVQGSPSISRKFNIDFLQIDVEGHDLDVLRVVEWDLIQPACVHFEWQHLNEKKQVAVDYIEKQGYTIKEEPMDILACRVKEQTS